MASVEKDPLEAALATAFSESPVLAKSHTSEIPAPVPSESAAEPLPASEEASGTDGSWKEEYDKLSAHWRAESARGREKAERERERWRAIREREEAEANLHPPSNLEDNEEKGVSSSVESTQRAAGWPASPSPADVRDLVTGEPSRPHRKPEQTSLPQSDSHSSAHRDATAAPSVPQSNADELSGSKTWEDVPSLDSSFPSFSLHDASSRGSLEHSDKPKYQQPPQPPSVTLAVFDKSLSRRARFFALMASLSINLLLPFVNGVMLGFGEIFAKNVIVYFGWQLPGVASVGVRARTDVDKVPERSRR